MTSTTEPAAGRPLDRELVGVELVERLLLLRDVPAVDVQLGSQLNPSGQAGRVVESAHAC